MTHLYVHIYIPSLNSDQHQNERSKYRSIIEIISRLNPTTFLPVFSVRCEISDRLIVPGHSIKPARNECGNKALFHSFLSANLIMAVELYRFPISTTRRAIPLSLPRCFAQTAAQKKIATVNRGEKILGRYEKYLFVRWKPIIPYSFSFLIIFHSIRTIYHPPFLLLFYYREEDKRI